MDASDPHLDPELVHPEARTVSPEVIETLRRTKGWTRFLSVLGYLSCGFMILAGLGMMASMVLVLGGGPGPRGGAVEPTPLALMGGVYIVAALIGVIPAVVLGRYAKRIGVLLKSRAELDLVAALDAQRSYWKMIGVFTIVMVALCVLGVISLVIVMVSGALLPTPAMIR